MATFAKNDSGTVSTLSFQWSRRLPPWLSLPSFYRRENGWGWGGRTPLIPDYPILIWVFHHNRTNESPNWILQEGKQSSKTKKDPQHPKSQQITRATLEAVPRLHRSHNTPHALLDPGSGTRDQNIFRQQSFMCLQLYTVGLFKISLL